MLYNILRRKDVCEFIEELFSTNNKKIDSLVCYCDMSNYEQVLFTFFDALFKYQIIIETDVFLDEYVEQVRKLFRKLDNFQDINLGIAKILGKICALKLNITNKEEQQAKKQILQYVYDRYIVEGYFFHGFSGVYKEQIRQYGFVPEEYQHFYSKFMEIDNIFNKRGFSSIMNKSFHENCVYFTDSFMMACYYGVNAPMYFYRLLGGANIDDCDKEAYFRNDYLGCFNNLNKLMRQAKLNNSERKYVTKVCCDEWKVLQKSTTNINILLVKRKSLGLNCLRDIEDIMNSDGDLGELLLKIINSKSDSIPVSYKLNPTDVSFIEIPNYKFLFLLRDRQANEAGSRKNFEKLNNAYGKVSVLILLGSLLITLGVILTIVTIGKGMW